MSRESRFWHQAARSVLMAIIFASTLITLFVAGPYLETRFLPVVSKLMITKMEPLATGETKVWAYFTKLRACDYIGIAWYQREGGDFVRVPLQLLRDPGDVSSPNRPVGSQKAGPWIVAMPIDKIRDGSFVELQHACHPGWVTTTEFYP